MTKKIIATSFVFLCLVINSHHLLGQKQGKGYQKGYIITIRGDTLRGLIKDRKQPPFEKLYTKIRFKGKRLFVRKLSPHQVVRYAIGNQIYESTWLEITQKLLKETYYSSPNVGRKVFLKVIAEGMLSLYYWEYNDQDSNGIDYTELLRKKDTPYLVPATQGLLGLKKQALADYLSDCPSLVEKIKDKSIKSPIEVVTFYNETMRKEK